MIFHHLDETLGYFFPTSISCIQGVSTLMKPRRMLTIINPVDCIFLSCQPDFCMLTDSTNIHLTLATNIQIAWVRDYVCQRFIMYTTTGAKSASHIIFLAEW